MYIYVCILALQRGQGYIESLDTIEARQLQCMYYSYSSN